MASYRDLIVWQRAMELVPSVYAIVRRLPPSERYALGNQMCRAVVSVAANIAEGQARQHRKEFIHALSIARGSLAEVDTLLLIAVRLGYATVADVRHPQTLVVSTRQLLQRLIQRLRRDSSDPSQRPS